MRFLIFSLCAWTMLAATPARSAVLAPDFVLESPDGLEISLSEVAGERPTILFFWASWCPYCKALMPHLQSILLEYGDSVTILAINFRDDGDSVAFVEHAGYDFTVLPNGDEVAALYGVYATPGVIIVDQDLTIRFNLYALPSRDPPMEDASSSHARKAAYRAPFWAAEIRKSIDTLLDESSK